MFGQHCSIDIWLAIPLCALRVVFVFVFAKKEMLLALKRESFVLDLKLVSVLPI